MRADERTCRAGRCRENLRSGQTAPARWYAPAPARSRARAASCRQAPGRQRPVRRDRPVVAAPPPACRGSGCRLSGAGFAPVSAPPPGKAWEFPHVHKRPDSGLHNHHWSLRFLGCHRRERGREAPVHIVDPELFPGRQSQRPSCQTQPSGRSTKRPEIQVARARGGSA